MAKTEVPNYHSACRALILAALDRPGMYMVSLVRFEAILEGHATAFQQLGLIRREEAFHSEFSDWLYRNHKISCSVGWAYGLVEYSENTGRPWLSVFRDFVEDFLREWQ